MPRDLTSLKASLVYIQTQRLKLFCDTKDGGELLFILAQLKTSVCDEDALPSPQLGGSGRSGRAAAADEVLPILTQLRGSHCPPPFRRAFCATTHGAAAAREAEGDGRSAPGVTDSNWNVRIPAEVRSAPGTLLGPALMGREAQAPPLFLPVPSPRGRPSAASRGRSVAAARAPQSDLGEPRRKNARALGGGEVIKGKEPAAGGSGRFSCSGRCCLGLGPPEGRLLEGRRCRPQ